MTLGVEEEVFVLEQGRLTPTLQSLDYLRRLWWSAPRTYWATTHSNFARGEDRRECFMGSIEVATGVHAQVDSLLDDLLALRTALAKAAAGARIVPTGALFTLRSPSNTASTHIHVGVPARERERVYRNLAAFAPLFALASANSPYAGGRRFGLSYRLAEPSLIGPLREDPEYRFQDLIISKRLGTIELRLCDPIPELSRLREVLGAVRAVAAWGGTVRFCREEYNRERKSWTLSGKTKYVQGRLSEVEQICSFDASLLDRPLTVRIGDLADSEGVEAAYAELDRIWREPTGVPANPPVTSAWRVVSGLLGYYAVRVPWIAWKGYKEWSGKAS